MTATAAAALVRKGIAFHRARRAEALIIRASGDHAFRLATGMLRRLSLSLALDA